MKEMRNFSTKIYAPNRIKYFHQKKSIYENDESYNKSKNRINVSPIDNSKTSKEILILPKTKKKKKHKNRSKQNISNLDKNDNIKIDITKEVSINNKLEKDIKINDINYNENKTNISNNENNKIDKKEKEIEKSEEDKIIQKIIINKFYLYLCFICIRKRKNIQNILLDEGMKVIKEKLDIINIFKNLCRDELYQEKEKINETEIIEMSDSCKNNLEIVYKNKFK